MHFSKEKLPGIILAGFYKMIALPVTQPSTNSKQEKSSLVSLSIEPLDS